MNPSTPILFLGAGKMGAAILRGLIAAGHNPAQIGIVEPHAPTRDALATLGVRVFEQRGQGIAWASTIVVAVKPQTWKGLGEDLLAELSGQASKDWISIMAGVTLAQLKANLTGQRVARVMPNLPLTVGAGAVGYCLPSQNAVPDALIEGIFAPIGLTVAVAESQMDALTGLSGSGPAWIFQVIEGLVQGGVQCGLTRAQAEDLTYQTLIGSAELWRKSGKNPGELTAEVCSPGGTTIAGIRVLEERALRGALMAAVEASAHRSAQLGA